MDHSVSSNKESIYVLGNEYSENCETYFRFSKSIRSKKYKSNVHDDGEDVVQAVFLKICSRINSPEYYLYERQTKLDRWKAPGSEKSPEKHFRLDVFINMHIRWHHGDQYKKHVTRRGEGYSLPGDVFETKHDVSSIEHDRQRQELVDCIENLPEDLRAVLVAKQYEKKTWAKIEEELGLPEGSGKKKFEVAIKLLTQCCQETD